MYLIKEVIKVKKQREKKIIKELPLFEDKPCAC